MISNPFNIPSAWMALGGYRDQRIHSHVISVRDLEEKYATLSSIRRIRANLLLLFVYSAIWSYPIHNNNAKDVHVWGKCV